VVGPSAVTPGATAALDEQDQPVDDASWGGGRLTASMPWDDDDDWVGEPPEGRYTRDRAKPEFWRQPWPWAGAGFALLLVIVVVVLVVR
jgi:hypothetical protein